MPKSKRNKVYSLTTARKKGMERKSNLLQQVRDCCDTYSSVYVFNIDNMSNTTFKQLRMEWKMHSRFFFGKNKVMQLALGRSESDEYKDNLHQVSSLLKGNTGLLFTNQPLLVVKKFFDEYCQENYAPAGVTVTTNITLPEGTLDQFAHSIEPHLRSLGLPTSLDRGSVTLKEDYTVCSVGDTLTPEQSKILKLLKIKLSEFKISLLCLWTATGDVTCLGNPPDCHAPMITNGHEE